jgi:hypothetical protein
MKNQQTHLGKIRQVITNPVVIPNGDGTTSGICSVQIYTDKPDFGPPLLTTGQYLNNTRIMLAYRRNIFAT